MVVTLEISQEPIGWLKTFAPINISHMRVTLEVSQHEIGSLNKALL